MEQIINVLTELKRQWGQMYVISQENTETITEIQTKLDEMTVHATRWMTFATVCACVGFVLAVSAATIWFIKWRSAADHLLKLEQSEKAAKEAFMEQFCGSYFER